MKFEVIPYQQTPKVNEITDETQLDENIREYIEVNREELEGFLEFASQQKNAVGLAANQCSLDGERFMARAFALMDLDTRKWKLIIDPIIFGEIGISEIKAEGCLTWKGKKIIAKRYRAVEVDYYDMDGVRYEDEIYKGFEGQIWQHEINHLNGVPEQVVDQSYPDPKPIDVGRNERCPCGSGKKYKKCCLLLI